MTAQAKGTVEVLKSGFSARPESVPLSQTNLPRWPAPSLMAKAPGCTYLAYCANPGAAEWLVAQTCLTESEIRAVGVCDEQLETAMGTDLVSAPAATRIVLCGPEPFVAVSAAVARTQGALDEELVHLVLDDLAHDEIDERPRDRRVFCGGCRTISVAHAAVGDLVSCSGCDTAVIVHFHYSRDTAAYLAQPIGRARRRSQLRPTPSGEDA
ncbi:hypothetical protein NOCA250008 [metagenome]|uniref:Dimethylamine monooxygenase subunit DmmA-like C-terminal domain-containing protein n=1 Tax=metagenome TaxID=256318 RepID=A0A2P2C8L7_9ZZZZ